MRLTKTDMARVIVQALYNLPELPAVDNHRVTRMVQRGKVEQLTYQHKLAVKVLLEKTA